jgi:phosphatidylethanolamine-binding protein (PEBP) family uncharacterized protein
MSVSVRCGICDTRVGLQKETAWAVPQIALDLKGATKSQIERAMQGHVLASAQLIGTYQKKR